MPSTSVAQWQRYRRSRIQLLSVRFWSAFPSFQARLPFVTDSKGWRH
jgi:hypothetical protein